MRQEFYRPCRDFVARWHGDPPMNRWAIIIRPLRDEENLTDKTHTGYLVAWVPRFWSLRQNRANPGTEP